MVLTKKKIQFLMQTLRQTLLKKKKRLVAPLKGCGSLFHKNALFIFSYLVLLTFFVTFDKRGGSNGHSFELWTTCAVKSTRL